MEILIEHVYFHFHIFTFCNLIDKGIEPERIVSNGTFIV